MRPPFFRFGHLVLLCFLTVLPAQAARFSTVVLDAGHGGEDPGGIPSNIIPEKGVALDVTKRTKDYLNEAGVRTIMTRNGDYFVSLDRRAAIGNAHKGAIFVSIHFNSGVRRGANGIESYYYSSRGKPLAQLLLRNVLKTTTGENRGLKHANFRVLRKAKNPAALIECGFLTNPRDVKLASSRKYRDQLARQIALAILEYQRSR